MFRRKKRRDCPRCDVVLVAEQRGPGPKPLEVDACPRCHGLYLDHGELMRLTGYQPLEELLVRDLRINTGDTLLCPSCFGFMEYQSPHGVQVDICSTCNGIWLDGGELARLGQPAEGDARAQRVRTSFTVLRRT